MTFFGLILREISFRRGNFILSVLALSFAVALTMAVVNMTESAERETTRQMRELGFNVLILPEGTDMGDFWAQSFARNEMPEEYVERLAKSDVVTIRHLYARLQKKYDVGGTGVLLTGVMPYAQNAHETKKQHMGHFIERGALRVGFEAGRRLGLSAGDTVSVGGRDFRVERVFAESGSIDDIRLVGNLHDVQAVLGLAGRINEIEALECLCTPDGLETIRADIEKILPGTHVAQLKSQALARMRVRRMVEKYSLFLLPLATAVATIWAGLLALSNVRERVPEIGILRALGVTSDKIFFLFLGRSALIGLASGVLGVAGGAALAVWAGTRIFSMTADKITPLPETNAPVVLIVIGVAVFAGYFPAMLAVKKDPAEVLRER